MAAWARVGAGTSTAPANLSGVSAKLEDVGLGDGVHVQRLLGL